MIAVEFLASVRCALRFFGFLDAFDPSTGEPVLTRLGCLQTVYTDVLANVIRLEVAVKNLSSNHSLLPSSEGQKPNINALQVSMKDIFEAELSTGRCKNIGSAYFAMLSLTRFAYILLFFSSQSHASFFIIHS